ncbi:MULTISPECIES: ABC transporter permease [Amycolatopsis]|uniref:ABC transporter permease n=1 Tax=Amycolatopsis sp. cg13 TaxID=3238807 RepID=UPI003524E631
MNVEVLALAERRLRQLRRSPGRVLGVALSPLISMVVLGYLFRSAISLPGGVSYQEYLFAGAAVQVGLATVGPTAIAVATDLSSGLVDRFRTLPIRRSAVLAGHTLADLLVGVGSLGLALAVGLLMGWQSHTGALSTLAGFAVVIVFLYAMVWAGAWFGLVMRSLESISSVTQLIVVVLPFFSTAFLPVGNFPAFVRPIAEWNPVSAVMSVVRRLWGNGAAAAGDPADGQVWTVFVVTVTVLLAGSVLASLRRFATAE